MKKQFENILKAIQKLPGQSQQFIITQLKELNNYIANLQGKNESFKAQLSGIEPAKHNDYILKSVDLLKLLGFNENTFESISSDFLNWMIENTVSNVKFNPKLMNFYLLDSLQQAFFITYAELDGKIPTYKQVKKTLLTFDETINKYESELKLSLPELLAKIDAKY